MIQSCLQRLEEVAGAIVGPDNVYADLATRTCYSYDAFLETSVPDLVVVPQATEQILPLVRAAIECGVPYTARGAGTGYSGGAIPVKRGMIILLTALRRIVELNSEEGWAWVEPGVVTGKLDTEARRAGWRYVPDPSSYTVCTIGGNIAENAGGPHCLAYGNTSNYVLEIELVTPQGELVRLGGSTIHGLRGLDIRGLIVGSEGTLGVVTGVRLRLSKLPESVKTVIAFFDDSPDALAAMEGIFLAGIVPAALDMSSSMLLPADGVVLSADPAVLFIDVEGVEEEVRGSLEVVLEQIACAGGRAEILERAELMARRMELVVQKFRDIRRLSGTVRYFLFDAGVPRSRLGAAMNAIRDAAARHQLPLLNSFHAGDGNIHPTPFFNTGDINDKNKIMALWREVLQECHSLGGTLSGEHGIGLEKAEFMSIFYSQTMLKLMDRIRQGFDPFNLCNPNKLFPRALWETETKADNLKSHQPTRIWPRLDSNPLDAVVTVAGDVTLAEVRQSLQGSNYELPWEPLGVDDDCTVAQAIEGGLPGLREWRSGPVRDLLLGGLLELPSGEKTEFGGRIAKDVAGYDIRKLILGSQGRLGKVLYANLKLMPKPARSYGWSTSIGSLSEGLELARQLFALQLPWAYLGLMGGTEAPIELYGLLELIRGPIDRQQSQLEKTFARLGLRLREPAANPLSLSTLLKPSPTQRVHMAPGEPWKLSPLLKRLQDGRAPRYLALCGMSLCVWVSGNGAAEPEEFRVPEPVASLERTIESVFAESSSGVN